MRLGLRAYRRSLAKMITVGLMGGLGNWLFQVSFVEYLKAHTGRDIYISNEVGTSPHSNTNYMSTIMQHWKKHLKHANPSHVITEKNLLPANWPSIVATYPDIHIVGYFQNYNYVLPTFLEKLVFNTDCIIRNPDIEDTVFLHIRGGDYLNHPVHGIQLDGYYERAIRMFPQGTKFSVFTNDIEYSKTKGFLRDVSHTFIHESEIDSLYLMSRCKGGICANSSFSWWGAFLNRNRILTLPSKWFNDPELFTNGYYFNEATIVEV
jgi:hypothetical protein